MNRHHLPAQCLSRFLWGLPTFKAASRAIWMTLPCPFLSKTARCAKTYYLNCLSLLILTLGTADTIVVEGGAVICPAALHVNTCSSEDERRVKTKVWPKGSLLDNQARSAGSTCCNLSSSHNRSEWLQKQWTEVQESSELPGLSVEQLRHNAFPRAAWGGCGRT